MKIEDMNKIREAWQESSSLFVALGDEQRQRILLMFEVGERLNVSSIVQESTLSRTAISHHLKVLKQAGVLRSNKVGKEVYFWIDKDFVLGVLQRVMDYVKTNT